MFPETLRFPKFLGRRTRLSGREWLLAQIVVENEVDEPDNKDW